MNELENHIIDRLKQLVPNAKLFEVRTNVSDKAYSFEFFVTIDDERYQCYEMIDNDKLNEKDFDAATKEIVEYIRTTSEYKSGEVNKFKFTAEV